MEKVFIAFDNNNEWMEQENERNGNFYNFQHKMQLIKKFEKLMKKISFAVFVFRAFEFEKFSI